MFEELPADALDVSVVIAHAEKLLEKEVTIYGHFLAKYGNVLRQSETDIDDFEIEYFSYLVSSPSAFEIELESGDFDCTESSMVGRAIYIDMPALKDIIRDVGYHFSLLSRYLIKIPMSVRGTLERASVDRFDLELSEIGAISLHGMNGLYLDRPIELILS